MTSQPPAQCQFCRHWQSPLSRGDFNSEPVQVCTAYPTKIPAGIFSNRIDHRQSQLGDRGIQWESVDGQEYPVWVLQTE